MTGFPDPPPGSRVRVERRGEALALTWPSGLGGSGCAPRATRTVVFVLSIPLAVAAGTGLVTSLVVFVPHFAFSAPGETLAGLCGQFLFSAAILWLAARVALDLRRYRPSERVVIVGDALVHSPARASPKHPHLAIEARADELSRLSDAARSLVPRGACAIVRARDIRGVTLEGKGAFGIVSIKVHGYDIDVGRRLDDADREWLVGVLRRWKESAG